MVNNIFNINYQLGTLNNYGQRAQQSNQSNNIIACRICNHEVSSFQAFMAHIESHLAQENHTMRGIYSPNHVNSQGEMIPSLLQPSIPRPTMMHEIRNFVNDLVFQSQPQQHMVMSQPGTNLFSTMSQPFRSLQRPPQSRNTEMAQLVAPQIHQREMVVSPIDGTKPFINTLEEPIKNQFINWADLNGDTLDLTLRL